MKNWSDEDLLDQLITRANQIGIISESNEVRELREEVLSRMSNGMANKGFLTPAIEDLSSTIEFNDGMDD
ncbi:MAG: hypothetical protein WC455_30545 [Dehalococcoidia bacterium]